MEFFQAIAVIGAGTMGHSIALSFAWAGYKVTLHDVTETVLQRSQKLIDSNLATLSAAGLIMHREAEAEIKRRICYTTALPSAVENKGIIVESIVEDANAKRDIYRQIDQIVDNETIISSNTSYLNIFEIYDFRRPENVLITHWYNPAHIIPLVEVVPGPQTSELSKRMVTEALMRCGKEVIVLKQYIPGFIGNRLQSALNLEAYYLLDEGIIDPQELDKVAALSFGLRLPILGIARRCDFTGLDLVQKILSNRSYRPPEIRGKCDTINRLVEMGKLGVKTLSGFYDYPALEEDQALRERDLKLIKLKKFLDAL